MVFESVSIERYERSSFTGGDTIAMGLGTIADVPFVGLYLQSHLNVPEPCFLTMQDSLDRLVPEGRQYRHLDEGYDDMPAHVCSPSYSGPEVLYRGPFDDISIHFSSDIRIHHYH